MATNPTPRPQWFDVLLHDVVRECVRRVDDRVISLRYVDLGPWDDVERWRPRVSVADMGPDRWSDGPLLPRLLSAYALV